MAPFDAYYLSQLKLANATKILAAKEWRKMGSLDDWGQHAGRITSVVSAGQAGAARDALTYTKQLGLDPVPVNVSAFAGTASDGRPLDSLMYSAVVHGREMSPKPEEQMRAGEKWLGVLAEGQVTDAGRGATSAIITATPTLGYYRYVSSPCCPRCAVLAGKWFKWNQGFQRHPQCKCRHIPAENGQPPAGYTMQIDPANIRGLTVEQRQAIADGADLNRVINAHRHGKLSANGMATLERAPRGAVRLTPEAIYRQAAGDRERAVELLEEHGYLRQPAKPIPAATPKPAPARLSVESTADWTDDQLDDALIAAFEREDGQAVEQLEAIMNARDLARQEAELAARLTRVRSSDPRKFTDDEIEAFSDDEFAIWRDAMRQIDGNGGVWREAGTSGKRLTTEQQLRADYDTFVYTEWLKAEEATNGVLFKREFKNAGLDPISLWSGPWHTAQARASEELLRYWGDHPRVNFATFKFQATGNSRYADAAAAAVKQTWQG